MLQFTVAEAIFAWRCANNCGLSQLKLKNALPGSKWSLESSFKGFELKYDVKTRVSLGWVWFVLGCRSSLATSTKKLFLLGPVCAGLGSREEVQAEGRRSED